MSLTYFIDGYNLIQSDWRLTKGSFDEQRKGLLALLTASRIPGAGRIFVVFDGKPGLWSPKTSSGLTVVFTYDLDADSWIKREVDLLKQAKNAVVVTNDKAIQFWVRGAGATALPCKEFLGAIKKSEGGRKGKGLSPSERREINDEFLEKWGD